MAGVAGWGCSCRKSKGGITEAVSQGRHQPEPQPGLCAALSVTTEEPGAGLAPSDPLVPHLPYRGEEKLFQTPLILPGQARETRSWSLKQDMWVAAWKHHSLHCLPGTPEEFQGLSPNTWISTQTQTVQPCPSSSVPPRRDT